MSFRIYLSPPDVGDLEKQYVLEALDSGWVAPLGPHVDAFEAEGFIWGGRWLHYDTMHFEYRPELLDADCRGSRPQAPDAGQGDEKRQK